MPLLMHWAFSICQGVLLREFSLKSNTMLFFPLPPLWFPEEDIYSSFGSNFVGYCRSCLFGNSAPSLTPFCGPRMSGYQRHNRLTVLFGVFYKPYGPVISAAQKAWIPFRMSFTSY